MMQRFTTYYYFYKNVYFFTRIFVSKKFENIWFLELHFHAKQNNFQHKKKKNYFDNLK